MREIQVVAAVMLKDDRVSLFRRSPEDSWPNYWEFPGGKIEAGETPPEALVREIREELGVSCQVLKDFGINSYEYPQAIVHLNLFLIEVTDYQFHLVDHSEWNFFSFEEISQLELAPADVPFLEKLKQYMDSRK